MNFKTMLAMAAFVLTAMSGANADTYAFLVGVNDYPEPVGADGKPLLDKDGKPMTSDLKGAVNDVNEMKGLLTNLYGVPEKNIRLATDASANEQGFLEGMRWLFQSAKPGDQAIFQFSGHGGQLKGKVTDDNPDGLDEFIVLSDDKLVTDKLFHELSRIVANKGIHVTFLFDSCHSGGMSREVAEAQSFRTKSVDLSSNKRAKAISTSQLAGLQAQARGIVTGTGQEKGSYAFLFASKKDQTSSDVSFKNNVKPAHGIFTLVMSLALKDKPEFGLDALEALVIDVLKELGYKQIPNFEYSSSDRANKPLAWK